ncbi:MAG: hypothetical protein WCG78_08940 [Candidatus Omnitrophota bacterium]
MMHSPKKICYSILFFLGWLLSPLTWWNDAFINIPLAYIAASLVAKTAQRAFLPAFLISYWVTNILGMALMHLSADRMTGGPRPRQRPGVFVATMVLYSGLAAFLIWRGIIKPF